MGLELLFSRSEAPLLCVQKQINSFHVYPIRHGCARAGWDLHVPVQREGLPLPCIAEAFCFCDIWATAAVRRRGLLFLEIISQVSMLFIKIFSICCKLVTLI